MSGALAGVRVVELGTEVAAPYCGWLLGGLGASVWKVEPPGGDPLRRYGLAADGSDIGGLFSFLNAGKHRRGAQPGEDQDDTGLRQLLSTAAVLIEDLGPGGLEGRGIDPAGLAAAGCVVVRLSPFGQDGPYSHRPASELVIQAMGGWVTSRNSPSSPPVQVGGRLPEYVHGVYAAVGALTALRTAGGPGGAAIVDVSAFESVHAAFPPPTLYAQTLRELGSGSVKAQHRPLDVVACKDGWVGINLLTAQQWMDVCALLEVPEFEDAWAELKQGGARLAEFERRTDEWLRLRTAAEIIEICQAFRIPAVPMGNGESMPEFEQWIERPFFGTMTLPADVDPGARELRHPGYPWRLSATPAATPQTPAPAPSGTGGAARSPAWSRRATDRPSADQPSTERPLAGIKVVDLASFWAGSYLTCFLGAFGADVIKVESIQRPDGFRYGKTFPALGADWYERSGPFRATNNNKRDLTLDLGSEDGRRLVRRLIADADVVVENYSARVVEGFGLGFDQVRALNPGAVMVRMPGFGLTGPWRDYVGWGNAFEQLGGAAWVTGFEDGPPCSLGGYADPIVAMHAAVATLAALRHRDETGTGQLVEVPQIEVVAAMAAEQVISRSLSAQVPGRQGNRSVVAAPQGVLAGDDERWWALSVGDAEWASFCDVLGRPDLAGDRALETLAGRRLADARLQTAVSEWARGRSAASAVQALRSAGIAAAILPDTEDFLTDPQLVHRGFYQELTHPVTGTEPYPGWPMRLTPGPDRHHRTAAPTLGQHNDEVLRDELGLDSAEILELARRNVIGTRPHGLDDPQ